MKRFLWFCAPAIVVEVRLRKVIYDIFASDKALVYSAGIETHGVNPKAIATMLEDGIDISKHSSNHIDEYSNIDFDFVITVCDNAKERCPYFPTRAIKFHYNFLIRQKQLEQKKKSLKHSEK